MKRNLLGILLVCLFPCFLWAQMGDTNLDPNYAATVGESADLIKEDSIRINTDDIDPMPYQWIVNEQFGTITPIPIDTAFINFPNTNHNEGMKGYYNHLGNLGSPRISHVWNVRKPYSQFYFIDPYSIYVSPGEFPFTNSRLPYTNITYYTAGGKQDAEEHLKIYFSRNAGRRFAVGFKVDYLYSLGFYQNQSNSQFNASFFSSYLGERYQAKLLYSYYYLKGMENGGIVDDRYITNPEAMSQGTRQFSGREIPVRFDRSGATTWNRNRIHEVFFTQSYGFGFHREHEVITPKDTSIVKEYVPVSSLIHTVLLQTNKHRFNSTYELSKNDTTFRYPHTYLRNDLMSDDSTHFFSIKNTFAVSLLEGFNKYAKAGLRAFLEYEYRSISLMPRDSMQHHMDEYHENEVFAGGELSKREGSLLHYNVIGGIGLLGESLGQFYVNGAMDLNFRLWNDSVSFFARGEISNRLPSFYLRHYHSNHYRWDNDDMKKVFRTRIEGELAIKRWRTRLRASMENITNYTYLDGNSLPAQETGSVQVISATLNQDFKLGILHFDNEVIWQKTTSDVLPLPEICLYHNLYIDTYLAKKALRVQLGADVRYFTKYYAPAYTPAIGQFHLQNEKDRVEIGNYPVITAYINFCVKRTRFFVQMYHVNQSTGNYFTVPHYPLNPSLLKLGLSWNFFD